MLSHLRFHRRAPSNPTSPLPELSQWESAIVHNHPQTTQDVHPLPDTRPRESTTANTPPTLPPIARVTSVSEGPSLSSSAVFDKLDALDAPGAPTDQRSSPPKPPQYVDRETSGFMGGINLQNYRMGLQGGRGGQAVAGLEQPMASTSLPASASPLPGTAIVRSKPPPPPINTGLLERPPPVPLKKVKISSFVTPTDVQSAPVVATGKRPAGTKLATEPASNTLIHSQSQADTQKAKKSLPFLKNPVSTLLARRRATPAPTDRTLQTQPSFPADSVYDPSIRGTRVHDFSQPRQRLVVTTDQHHTPQVAPPPGLGDEQGRVQFQPGPRQDVPRVARDVPTPFSDPPAPARAPARPESSDGPQRALSFADRESINSTERMLLPQEQRRPSLNKKPLPMQPTPPVPPKDANFDAVASGVLPNMNSGGVTSVTATTRSGSFRSTPSAASARSRKLPTDEPSLPSKTNPSLRASMSRNVSLSGLSAVDGVISAVPRHMKSTSSRFSFDMIGAAKQEKLLEERHRQRAAQEKQMVEPSAHGRDSRYDDLDDFDYDAMIDDDGLEERIPGVNADAEDDDMFYNEEDIPMVGDDSTGELWDEVQDEVQDDDEAAKDPDNDQENFSGFVFQRSNPTSTLVSPHTPGGIVATPRDDSGRVIGFAITKDSSTPELTQHDGQPFPNDARARTPTSDTRLSKQSLSGLGIASRLSGLSVELGTETHEPNTEEAAPPQPPVETLSATRPLEDELYYDDGLNDEFNRSEWSTDRGGYGLNSGDVVPFDESIFDDDDTDQYGRPIPGAFAQAQARRAAEAAERREAAKRESDVGSRFSTQSTSLSHSTAHTSLSTDTTAAPADSRPDVEGEPRIPRAICQDGEVKVVVEEEEEWEDGPETRMSWSGNIQPAQGISERDVMYQAALAEAAHLAAASGKFRRDSSPPPPTPANLIITSPTTASDAPLSSRSLVDPARAAANEEEADEYYYDDDGPYTQDMEDYDFDDEDIVAEANASALANDSDGFYGQEFGFYSAPPPTSHHHYHHGSGVGSSGPNAGARGGASALNAQNLFTYSSGGYFDPSGLLARSTSGRVVSREPNLTPITERSEYSNRNSIMSLGLPSAVGSGSGDRGLQSPGLAQLAMMADDGDMTLSALMRLRSRAWGGSQASLVSSSREGSPRSEMVGAQLTGCGDAASGHRDGPSSPWMIPALGGTGTPHQHHVRKNSAFSVLSRDWDASSGTGSPTMTMNMVFGVSSPSPGPGPPTTASISSSPSPLAVVPSPRRPSLSEDENTPTDAKQGAASVAGSWMTRSRSAEDAIRRTVSTSTSNSAAFKANGVVAASALAQHLHLSAPFPPPRNPSRPGIGHARKTSSGSIPEALGEKVGLGLAVDESRI